MEEALKQQIEELNRSRNDYSILFQNFKQARILFEERDDARSIQLLQLRNTCYICTCGCIYMDISIVICTDTPLNSDTFLFFHHLIGRDNKALEKKLFQQASKIKAHQVSKKSFENDVMHLQKVNII